MTFPRRAHQPRRAARASASTLAARTLVAALAVGGALAVVDLRTIEVTIERDGNVRVVEARADRVQEVLTDAGVALTAADKVTPARQESVQDGQRITIVSAKTVHLEQGGSAPVTLAVAEPTVGAALDELNLRGREHVTVSRAGGRVQLDRQDVLTDGVRIDVATASTVTVLDGKTTALASTHARTRDDLLRERGITLAEHDRVTGPTQVTTGATYRIERATTRTVTARELLPYATRTLADDQLLAGRTKVTREGVHGQLSRRVAITRVDGRVVEREVLSATKRDPVTQVVHRGTRVPAKPTPAERPAAAAASVAKTAPTPTTSASPRPVTPAPRTPAPAPRPSSTVTTPAGADHLNWGALAMCESTNNPRAISPTGAYRGMYQFSFPTWRAVGGSGDPAQASVAEQTARAKILYLRAGAGQWPVCGARLFT